MSQIAMSMIPTATERSPWPTRLLVGHHRRPDLERIEIAATVIEQRRRVRFLQTGQETLLQQAALGIASVRIEAVAHDLPAIDLGIGVDRQDGDIHLGKRDIGVGDIGSDRNPRLLDVGNSHACSLSCSREND
ncbi:hypothetical protein ACRHM7_04865 [Chromohalobacter israelensis]|uniref:hypothetical protein n=1 Tax=Chromohalobacter israelensis TaxID=141390 RepID=UPI003D7BA916